MSQFGEMTMDELQAVAEAAQAAVVSEARDRADLLARELNHRVKNLFAVVLAIVQMSARDRPEAKEVTDSIAQRIRALLTAHEVSQGELERPVASLRALVETFPNPISSNARCSRGSGSVPEAVASTARRVFRHSRSAATASCWSTSPAWIRRFSAGFPSC